MNLGTHRMRSGIGMLQLFFNVLDRIPFVHFEYSYFADVERRTHAEVNSLRMKNVYLMPWWGVVLMETRFVDYFFHGIHEPTDTIYLKEKTGWVEVK